jgi:hypothetical protein
MNNTFGYKAIFVLIRKMDSGFKRITHCQIKSEFGDEGGREIAREKPHETP